MTDQPAVPEYRDPDAHYGSGRNGQDAGTMYCNQCGSAVDVGDDMWVCNHDSAWFEYARPEEPETGFPTASDLATVASATRGGPRSAEHVPEFEDDAAAEMDLFANGRVVVAPELPPAAEGGSKTGVPEVVYLDAARDYIRRTGWECDGSKTAERQALNLSATGAWRDACASVWAPAIAEGVRAGRQQAAAAIRAYAEKHATVVSGRTTRLGLHLEAAAQVAVEGAHGG